MKMRVIKFNYNYVLKTNTIETNNNAKYATSNLDLLIIERNSGFPYNY